jgi:WD40 repeat protein
MPRCLLVFVSSLALVIVFISTTVPVNAAGPIPGVWLPTGSMHTARSSYPSATLLLNGQVLVAGGFDVSGNTLASAELYDPSTGLWTATGSMTSPRGRFAATLLADGRVLAVGGDPNKASAEIYDPGTGEWTATPNLHYEHAWPLVTTLSVGPLAGVALVASGFSGGEVPIPYAELYSPGRGTWTLTGSMHVARYNLFGTNLPDGSVLASGEGFCCPYASVNSAEIFNTQNQTWMLTADKTTRANGPLAMMPGGRVLEAGGYSGVQGTWVSVADAELYDSVIGVWFPTANMSTPRDGTHSLTAMPNGQALVAGGNSGGWGVCSMLSSSELYDPTSGQWLHTGSLSAARNGHQATLLPSGQVLVAGGGDCVGHVWSSAELYTPTTASLLISPDRGAPATNLTMTGSGFAANEAVDIYQRGYSPSPVYSLAADGNGSFTLPFREPQIPYGVLTDYAIGKTSGKIGACEFQVTARLVMSPNTGAPGDTALAKGLGFGAGEAVKIYWNNPRTFLGTTIANNKGGASLTITIPTGVALGASAVFGVGQTTKAIGKGWITVQ